MPVIRDILAEHGITPELLAEAGYISATAPRGALDLPDVRSPDDYVLKEGHESVWVLVNNVSVYIVRHEDHVSVELYAHQCEADSVSLGETSASYAEAQKVINRYS